MFFFRIPGFRNGTLIKQQGKLKSAEAEKNLPRTCNPEMRNTWNSYLYIFIQGP